MSYVLSRKFARATDCDFIVAAARAFYCDWYLSDEKRAARIERPGVELTDEIPETQRWAFRLARAFATRLATRANESRGYAPPHAPTASLPTLLAEWVDIANASPGGDRDPTEENFGWYAAMQAMGHGVGLNDAFGFRVEVPHAEAYPR